MDAPSTPSLPQPQEKVVTPTAPDAKTKPPIVDIAQMTKLYELGVISKEKLQQIVLQICPDPVPVSASDDANPPIPDDKSSNSDDKSSNPAINPSPEVEFIRRKEHFRAKRKALTPNTPKTNAASTPPSKKKARPGRSSPNTSSLRKIVKDPTRRRFFEECLKLDSILWSRVPGHRKSEMDALLFARASKDPMDELYSTHPGTLHSVEESKLRAIVKWQVCFILI